MSADDRFEAELRRRLVDLAEAADRDVEWDDPLPVARELAAAGIAPDDDPAILAPAPVRPPRRRWLPGLAVAAVLLAVVAGAGVGIRALTGSGSSGSASSVDAAAGGGTARSGGATAGGASSPTPGATVACPRDVTDCASGAPCGTEPVSTGPLAQVASIRPSGFAAPTTTVGGSAAITYQLTFATAGGEAQVSPAEAVTVSDGRLCPAPAGVAAPGAVQVVPVAPGAGQSGTVQWPAVDASGAPLPAGSYQVAVVVRYSVEGSGSGQVVSPPVTVTVGGS